MPRRGWVSVQIAPQAATEIAELLRQPANWRPEPFPETSFTRHLDPDPSEVRERCGRLAHKFELYGRQRHRQTHLMSLRREDAGWVASVAARAKGRQFEDWLTSFRSRASSRNTATTGTSWLNTGLSRARQRPPDGVYRAITALATAASARPGRPRLAPYETAAISSGAVRSSPRNVQRVRRRMRMEEASLAYVLALTDVTNLSRR